MNFELMQTERRRKDVWQQLQVAHRLPAAEREALRKEYQELLQTTNRLRAQESAKGVR